MISSLQELVDAVSFERFALAEALPLVDKKSRVTTMDLRNSKIVAEIVLTERLGIGMGGGVTRWVRPLLFGAAFKVMDLTIEFGMKDLTPPRSGKWSFGEKSKEASTAAPPPFDRDPEVWSRVADLYTSTVEPRHCLIHRGFELASDGSMTRIRDPKTGAEYPNITAGEQRAYCRLAQHVVAAVETGSLRNRERLDVVFNIDQLTRHHGHSALGGGVAYDMLAELVLVNAVRDGSEWVLNVPEARASARQRSPSAPFLDVEVVFGDSGLRPLRGRFEDLPDDAALSIDPMSPPEWASKPLDWPVPETPRDPSA